MKKPKSALKASANSNLNVKKNIAPSPSCEAIKFDQEKEPMDLLPYSALKGTSRVLAYGANKYARHNWRKGFDWSRLIAAAMRHLHAFNDGENVDPESELPHLDHAACMLMFLQAHYTEGLGNDDRFLR